MKEGSPQGSSALMSSFLLVYSLFFEPSSLIVNLKDHGDRSMNLELAGDYVATTNPSEFPRCSPACPSTWKFWHPMESLHQGQQYAIVI
jgi:hypothetical protein